MRFHDANTNGSYADAGDNVLYYTSDANMNVTALVDASTGAVVERYHYDPYGAVLYLDPSNWNLLGTQASAFENDYLYTGRRLDAETDLFYYRARYYDTSLGRFISRDPIGYGAGWNLYQYVRGGPLSAVDPMGLEERSPLPFPIWHSGRGNRSSTPASSWGHSGVVRGWDLTPRDERCSAMAFAQTDCYVEIITWINSGPMGTGHSDIAVTDRSRTTTVYGQHAEGNGNHPTLPNSAYKKRTLQQFLDDDAGGRYKVSVCTKVITCNKADALLKYLDQKWRPDAGYSLFDDNCAQNASYACKKFDLLENWEGTNVYNDDDFQLPEGDFLDDWLAKDTSWNCTSKSMYLSTIANYNTASSLISVPLNKVNVGGGGGSKNGGGGSSDGKS